MNSGKKADSDRIKPIQRMGAIALPRVRHIWQRVTNGILTLSSAAGIGGVTGAVVLSAWGGTACQLVTVRVQGWHCYT